MAETQTPNFHWTKPDLGGDASTWGNVLNTTIDAVDSVAYANQQSGVPIGSMTMWAGPTASPPANWLICDGSTLDYGVTPAYQGLFNVIGRAFNPALTGTQFALPNLVQKFPIGAGSNVLGAIGGTFSYTLDVAHLPSHAHIVEQTPHNHGASASGGAHAHGISDVDPGHVHSINAVFGGGSEIQSGSGWGQHNIVSGGNTTGISTTDTQAPAISVSVAAAYANIPGNSTDNTGGGAAMSIVPPFIAINFIIRAV